MLLFFFLALNCVGCRRVPAPEPGALGSSASDASSASSLSSALSPSSAPSAPAVAPSVLLALASSAYNASLGVDEEAVYVLTSEAAHRLVPGKPPEKTALDLGYGATLTRHFILFWSKGAIWKAPKRGGKPIRMAALAQRPQYFASSADSFAWLGVSEDSHFSVQTLAGTTPRLLYTSAGKVDALTLLEDWVFFVERVADSSWRFGKVRVAGGAAEFTATKTGRSPSMLSAWRDLYYYDGNTREVRVLSPDFQRDQTLAKDFICSPIAVWEKVYCAQVQGLFEILGEGRAPRLLQQTAGKSITNIAVDANRVVWLSDIGPDQLTVNLLSRTLAP
jgi:hypothetical protein